MYGRNMVETLTDDQISEFTEVFRLIDADGDGVISAGELGGAMRRVGLTPTEAQVQDLVSMHAASDHADGGAEQTNAEVDLNRFLSMMTNTIKTGRPQEDLLDAFRTIDRDQDGFITATELRVLLYNMGEDASEDEAQQMIREADQDGDGKVNFQEFMRLMSDL